MRDGAGQALWIVVVQSLARALAHDCRLCPWEFLRTTAMHLREELVDTVKVLLGGKVLDSDAVDQIALPTALGGGRAPPTQPGARGSGIRSHA